VEVEMEEKVNYKTLRPFLGKFVRLGVPNLFGSAKPFYHFGKILSLDERFLTIENHKGDIILVPIGTIVELSTLREDEIKGPNRMEGSK
jgi:hypothetical protein